MSSPSSPERRGVALLGSTGSIGTQAIEVIAAHPELFRVVGLAAGRDGSTLAEQARQLRPAVVALAESDAFAGLDLPGGTDRAAGDEALLELATRDDVDLVVVATGGVVSLRPVLAALRAGKVVATANKETLVAGGHIVMPIARRLAARSSEADPLDPFANPLAWLRPIDSEHSAIWQCLVGESMSTVAALVLTGSGGPFLDATPDELAAATPERALKHPTWTMGAKITIDSATLANKGLEVIEAHWLYDVDYDAIEVVIHPQSVVHSAVRFVDGSLKAQLGTPDMRLPIQYAMTYPDRRPSPATPPDLIATATAGLPRAGHGAVPGVAHRPRGRDRRPARLGRVDRRRRRGRQPVPRGLARLQRDPASAGGRRRAVRRWRGRAGRRDPHRPRCGGTCGLRHRTDRERSMTGFFQSIITVVLFLAILGILVVIHELGHFVTARLANVRVLEFGVGFPPRAKVLRAKGETLYTLNWLPIGGFVKLAGEDGNDADDPRSFAAQRWITKMVILAAGVAMNVLLAFVIFTGIAWLASPLMGIRFHEVVPGSPAQAAGLQPGDAIVAVDGERYQFIAGLTVLDGLRSRPGETVVLTVDNADGARRDVTVTLRDQAAIDAGQGALGISQEEKPWEAYFDGASTSNPLPDAIAIGAEQTVGALGLILGGLGTLVSSVAADPTAPPPVAGPVGIATQIGDVFWNAGPILTLYVAGILSANLALVNILPFPPLDGGRMLMITLKRLFGRRISLRAEQLTYVVGMVFLFAFILWVTGYDIIRSLTGGTLGAP